MLRLIFGIFLCLSTLYANAQNNNVSATTQAELAKIFVNPNQSDAIDESNNCTWTCRKVNGEYATQISGFDFKRGIVYCRVYEKSDGDTPLVYNANKQRKGCVSAWENQNVGYTEIASLIENNKKYYQSKIAHNENENQITMSRFLSGLATLDPAIIDREATSQTGTLQLIDGKEMASVGIVENKGISFANTAWDWITGTKGTGDVYIETSAIDGFNKNNMAYFNNLFINMEKVYQHLQVLLFIVVGGFYLSSISAHKLQIYLENRGESASNQPYLHKFYIPLLMVGTFFMPIPEANGISHSTICQNIIRYFTAEATKVADIASAIGGKTYMEKIYKQSGGIDEWGLKFFINDLKLNQYKVDVGETIYKSTCSQRYQKIASHKSMLAITKMTEEQKEDLLKQAQIDKEKFFGTDKDITMEACIFLEREINNAKNEIKKLHNTLSGIKEYYSDNKNYAKINTLDGYLAQRELQLGWINSLITPSSAILAEILTYADIKIEKEDMESATQQNIENNKKAQQSKDVDITDDSEVKGGIAGFVSSRLVWLMLPGAQGVKDFVNNMYDKIESFFNAIIGFVAMSNIIIKGGVSKLFSIGQTPIVYYISSVLIESTFEKVPLLVCTTASVIAFVSYLVSLCKYFYISPFVVAFSLATKRMDKIVEFLISGISIFFKPILIVLFIYLALFVHTLISEVFLFISIEQFAGVQVGFFQQITNYLTIFVANAICGLLKIFGVLASSYIMWKLIVSGPGWALSLVGIDGKHDDMISQGIETHLAKRAFVA